MVFPSDRIRSDVANGAHRRRDVVRHDSRSLMLLFAIRRVVKKTSGRGSRRATRDGRCSSRVDVSAAAKSRENLPAAHYASISARGKRATVVTEQAESIVLDIKIGGRSWGMSSPAKSR